MENTKKELKNLHLLETLCNKECWFFNEDGYMEFYKRAIRVKGNKEEASVINVVNNRTHDINLSKTGLLSWEGSASKEFFYQFPSFNEAMIWWNKYIPFNKLFDASNL